MKLYSFVTVTRSLVSSVPLALAKERTIHILMMCFNGLKGGSLIRIQSRPLEILAMMSIPSREYALKISEVGFAWLLGKNEIAFALSLTRL